MADILERFLAGEPIADLARVYTVPPLEVEMMVRQELAASQNGHERQSWP